jgi:hypothetical protein
LEPSAAYEHANVVLAKSVYHRHRISNTSVLSTSCIKLELLKLLTTGQHQMQLLKTWFQMGVRYLQLSKKPTSKLQQASSRSSEMNLRLINKFITVI